MRRVRSASSAGRAACTFSCAVASTAPRPRSFFEVVPGSGTGELAGLRGTGSFTTVPGASSFPCTFRHDLG
ncbi:DUF3224 domain-containing protein [Streptomyces nigrescens]